MISQRYQLLWVVTWEMIFPHDPVWFPHEHSGLSVVHTTSKRIRDGWYMYKLQQHTEDSLHTSQRQKHFRIGPLLLIHARCLVSP